MDLPAPQAVDGGGALADPLLEQRVDAEAAELLSAQVQEQRPIGFDGPGGSSQEAPDPPRGVGPDRADPDFTALAAQANLVRRLHAHVLDTQIQHLLNACAGV